MSACFLFQTFLPKLEKLNASHNNLTKLERDFHGLPILCFADLSNNHISYIAPDLVSKTRCSSHGVVNKLEVLLQGNLLNNELIIKCSSFNSILSFFTQRIPFYATKTYPN